MWQRNTGKTRVAFVCILISSLWSQFAWPSERDLLTPEGDAEVIVTATRTHELTSDALPAVTVLTREDIERTQAKTLPELLAGVAGLEVTTNGGIGHESTIFFRGTNSNHSVVLIDGVRVGSATTGAAAWQFLPPSQIEKIEIVRGPRSFLYGSGAIGGVVQIFTRANSKRAAADISAGVGTQNTSEGLLRISGGTDRSRIGLTLSRLATDGFNVQRLAPGSTAVPESDKDGSEINSVSLRANHTFTNDAHIDATFLRSQGTVDFDGGFQDSTKFVQQSLGFGGVVPASDHWMIGLGVGRSGDYADNYKSHLFVNSFDTTRNTAYLQSDASFSNSGTLSIGADFQREEVQPASTFDSTSRTTIGTFALLQQTLGKARVELGARNDHYDSFGNKLTGSTGLGYTIGRFTKVMALYGTAFRAPSFNQLYLVGYGDPNLKPERSATSEIGIEYVGESRTGSIRLYSTHVNDLIAAVCDASFNCAPENVDRARIRGLEAQVGVKLGETHSSLATSFIDPRDQRTGRLLARRAKRTAKLEIDQGINSLHIGIVVIAESGRYDNAANTTWIAGHVIANAHASYRLTPSLQIHARLENLLDKDYQTVASFNTPGRTAFISLEWGLR